jgi:hypothetical protein
MSARAYFKGPSLAARFFKKPHVRQCRDIDVLVPLDDVKKVVSTALEAGYRIDDDEYAAVSHRGEEALAAYLEMSDVAFMRSPRGIAFEIHGSLDRKSRLFEPKLLFEHAQDQDFFGQKIRVMEDELLFCYVAYHATNHTWSRLNWFSDAHAILSAKDFNREICRKWARRLGIEDLVDATIEINDWCSSGALTPEPPGQGAKEIFRLFCANLEGGLDAELQLKQASKRIGLPARFRASGQARLRAFFHILWVSVFSPNFSLYRRVPLPRKFWWVYAVIRPTDFAIRRLGNGARRLLGRVWAT